MKTAVEWLKDTLYPYFDKEDREYTNILFNQAKQMEKEQMIDAYDLGSLSDMQYPDPKTVIENGEQYYNETFKSL